MDKSVPLLSSVFDLVRTLYSEWSTCEANRLNEQTCGHYCLELEDRKPKMLRLDHVLYCSPAICITNRNYSDCFDKFFHHAHQFRQYLCNKNINICITKFLYVFCIQWILLLYNVNESSWILYNNNINLLYLIN